MIDDKLRVQILDKLGKSKTWFYYEINRLRKDLNYTVSNEVASYLIASENGIDPTPYMQDVSVKEEFRQAVQMRRGIKPSSSPNPAVSDKIDKDKKGKITSNKIIVQLPNIDDIEIQNLSRSIVEDAAKMTAIYPIIYLFENSVREFIKNVLDKRRPDWWEHVRDDTKKRVEDRKKTETQNAYHGKTRIHAIQYVDFDDLRNIIQNNANIFNEFMPDKNVEYMQQKLREVKDSRNILMHCNPLTERDMTRVKIYFTDWQNQLKTIKQKLEEK